MAQDMPMDGVARLPGRLADPGRRREHALEVLRRAEARVGVRASAARGPAAGAPGESGRPRSGPTGEASDRVGGGPAEGLVPVPAPFASRIAGLPVGAAVRIEGSMSLLLAFAAAATSGPERADTWIAVVGMPDLCLAAAAEAGVDLDRIVLVPDPGERPAPVVAAAVDGFEVVLLGPAAALGQADLRSLLHRVRHRSGLLLTTEPCPGVAVTVRALGRTWRGLERGYGLLRAQEVRVRLTGRGVDERLQVRLGEDPMVAADEPVTATGQAAAAEPKPFDLTGTADTGDEADLAEPALAG